MNRILDSLKGKKVRIKTTTDEEYIGIVECVYNQSFTDCEDVLGLLPLKDFSTLYIKLEDIKTVSHVKTKHEANTTTD